MPGPTLVTGAAGFAGSHLLDLLSARNTDIVAWRRPTSGAPPRAGRIRWQGIEALDRAAVRAAIDDIKPSRVFHCAGAAHVGQAWDRTADTLAVNVLGTHHLVEALRDLAPEARMLIPSSALVYAPSSHALSEERPLNPAGPYGLSKLAQEMLAFNNTSGPKVWVARPFNHFGPRQDSAFVTAGFARQIADIEAGHRAPEISVGNLSARRDLTDVRDTVRAYDLILEHGRPERPYNVCSERALCIRDLLDMLLARARVPIAIVQDPARYRPNDSAIVLGDASRIKQELGWAPAIPLERTLDDLLAYWRDRVGAT
jgi:GDP-4-dehydro-6-deoxy-D-mannose reductase